MATSAIARGQARAHACDATAGRNCESQKRPVVPGRFVRRCVLHLTHVRSPRRNISRAELFVLAERRFPAGSGFDESPTGTGGGVSDAVETDVSQYYDLLHLWTKFNSGFRVYSGVEAHAIHRWLTDPDTGDFSPATIHRIMLASGIRGNTPIDALDAGCGYGGSIFALQAALAGRWHGVTISGRQCAVARAVALQMELGETVSFARRSYDMPQARQHNLVYGIESLIHSPDPSRTIANLAGALRPGGCFIIVDDMPVDDVPPALAGDLASFKRLWRCPVSRRRPRGRRISRLPAAR